MTVVLDDRLIGLIGSEPSIIIGTCDAALVPSMARGFGARVIRDGAAIEVLISRWPGPGTLENIARTGRIAVTFTAPESFVSVQIKGRALDWGDCTSEDLARAERYAGTIRQRIVALGEPPEQVLPTYSPVSPFRVTFAPEAVYDQTPGSTAGQRL